MGDHALPGRLVLVFDVPAADATAALFLRRLLKRLWRDRGWKCRRGELHTPGTEPPDAGHPVGREEEGR
jgi:hypothetical protein